MSLKLQCPHPGCGKSYRVSEEHVGRKTRCPACQREITVGDPTLDTAAAGGTRGSQDTLRSDRPAKDTQVTAQRIGRFEIREQLGVGAFGEVYRAHDRTLDREVALKVPRAGTLASARALDRFLREGKAAAQLRHPHIVPVYDAGQAEGRHYIASAFIQGRPLSDLVADGPLDFHRAASIVRALGDALAYAHEQGVVHRDIKPDNVMIDQGGQPHIMDFGLARVEESTDKMTQDGTILGTAAYMAPEQARGELDQVGPASDQYSLGVVLYELLTGQTPFSGPPQIVLFNVLEKEPPAPRTLRSDIPLDLETICQRSMAKEASRRYVDCYALAEDLRRYLDNEPIAARRLSPIERFQRWRRRNPVVAGLTAALFVVLAAGILISSLLAWQSSQRATAARTVAKRADDEAKRAGEQEQLAKARSGELALRLGESYFEQGTHWCEMGDPARGLLSFAAAWRAAPADAADLRRVTLSNLGGWSSQLHALEAAYDCGAQYCHAAAISPDGRWLATSANTGTTRVFDTTTGAKIMESPLGGSALWFYDDGKSLVLARGGIHFLDVSTGTEKWQWQPQAASFTTIAVLPEADRLLTAPTTDTLQLWNLQTGTAVGPALNLAGRRPERCQLDRDAKVLAVAGLHFAQVWDLQTGQQRGKTIPTTSQIGHIDISPDGTLLAVAARNREIELWNTATVERIGQPLPHGGDIYSLSFGPDGGLIASGSSDGYARVWNVANGALVGEPLPHGGFVLGLAFRPDGRQLATSGTDDMLRLWDVSTGRRIGQGIPCLYDLRPGQFTADGSRLLVSGSDPTVRLWRLAPEPAVELLPRQFLSEPPIFAPDGRHFLAWGSMSYYAQWDANDGRVLHDQIVLDGLVDVRAMSPSGRMLVGRGRQGRPMLWQLDRPERPIALAWGDRPFSGIGFSDDERWLIVGDGDGRLQRYRAADGQAEGSPVEVPEAFTSIKLDAKGERIAVLTGKGGILLLGGDGQAAGKSFTHPHPNPRVLFRPESNQVLTYGGDGIARLWNADGQVVREFGHPGELTVAAFDPTGARLILVDKAKTVRVWDVESGTAVGGDLPHDESVMLAALTPGGLTARTVDQKARLFNWDVRTGQHASEIPGVFGMAFSPDATTLTTATVSATAACLWDLDDLSAPAMRGFGHSFELTGAAFSSDGARYAVASMGGDVRLWNSADAAPLAPILEHESFVSRLVFSPDGRTLLTASNNECRLWEVPAGTLLYKLPHTQPVTAIGFSGDGRHALVGAGGIYVWDVATGAAVSSPPAPVDGAAAITVVAFSPDGQRCLTQNPTHTGLLCEVATGRTIGGPLAAIDQGQANQRPVAAFSADSRLLITAAIDNSARLWDAGTGQPLARPLQHQGEVWAVGFNASGTLAFTGSMDGQTRLWDSATGLSLGPPLVVAPAHVAAVSPDGRTVITGHMSRVDFEAGEPSRQWTIPPSAPQRDGPAMERWAQVLTGLELLPEGNFALLPAAAWNERRAAFVSDPRQP